jgi:hypothetical protein
MLRPTRGNTPHAESPAARGGWSTYAVSYGTVLLLTPTAPLKGHPQAGGVSLSQSASWGRHTSSTAKHPRTARPKAVTTYYPTHHLGPTRAGLRQGCGGLAGSGSIIEKAAGWENGLDPARVAWAQLSQHGGENGWPGVWRWTTTTTAIPAGGRIERAAAETMVSTL